MDAGLAGHGRVVALEAVGTVRGYWGHGARPEDLGSFAHPSKAASAGAELVLWILTSSLWCSHLLPEDDPSAEDNGRTGCLRKKKK